MKKIFQVILVLLTGLLSITQNYAQDAQLSIQGILKKADGKAVDDGPQNLKFALYTAATAGTQVWTETQNNVEVVGGIYSVQLGAVNPLTATFDVPYFLGVSVGSNSEMLPRMRLTSAPYALSLRGQSNQFPSTGQVKADAMLVAGNETVSGNETISGNETVSGKLGVGGAPATLHSVNVTGGYLARGGVPGTGGANNNGYSFQNQLATGMFSYQAGKVGIYTNGEQVARIYHDGGGTTGVLELDGNLSVSGRILATLNSGSGIAVKWSNGELVRDNSSARYKENISALQENFSLLLQAQPKKYTRPGNPNSWETGFIAEEFEALGLRSLVVYDEQGRPDGLHYDKFVTYMIPLLREQSEKVSDQATRIITLEAENTELRNMFSSLRADVDALKSQR